MLWFSLHSSYIAVPYFLSLHSSLCKKLRRLQYLNSWLRTLPSIAQHTQSFTETYILFVVNKINVLILKLCECELRMTRELWFTPAMQQNWHERMVEGHHSAKVQNLKRKTKKKDRSEDSWCLLCLCVLDLFYELGAYSYVKGEWERRGEKAQSCRGRRWDRWPAGKEKPLHNHTVPHGTLQFKTLAWKYSAWWNEVEIQDSEKPARKLLK